MRALKFSDVQKAFIRELLWHRAKKPGKRLALSQILLSWENHDMFRLRSLSAVPIMLNDRSKQLRELN